MHVDKRFLSHAHNVSTFTVIHNNTSGYNTLSLQLFTLKYLNTSFAIGLSFYWMLGKGGSLRDGGDDAEQMLDSGQ